LQVVEGLVKVDDGRGGLGVAELRSVLASNLFSFPRSLPEGSSCLRVAAQTRWRLRMRRRAGHTRMAEIPHIVGWRERCRGRGRNVGFGQYRRIAARSMRRRFKDSRWAASLLEKFLGSGGGYPYRRQVSVCQRATFWRRYLTGGATGLEGLEGSWGAVRREGQFFLGRDQHLRAANDPLRNVHGVTLGAGSSPAIRGGISPGDLNR
jgi:hypothetical protein